MKDLIDIDTLSEQIADFLRSCVQLRLNMVISGGTGTGKTTMLNSLSDFIPERERIITIEDPIELKLQQGHVIACEARPPNIEGRNEVTQRDLVRNALRMRPDRIIVGEVRGPEAFDMMQAMNTGHEGSLTTVHANSPRDALARIENMVLMAGFDLPVRAIREQMAAAFHLVVQLSRFADGSRRVTSVSEVVGMEETTVTMQELLRSKSRAFTRTGGLSGSWNRPGSCRRSPSGSRRRACPWSRLSQAWEDGRAMIPVLAAAFAFIAVTSLAWSMFRGGTMATAVERRLKA